MDHRMRRVDDMDLRYGLRHAMSFTAGGRFAKIAGATEIQVNSLHGQGVDRPAPSLEAEGPAPDGPPEPVPVPGPRRLAPGRPVHHQDKPQTNNFSTPPLPSFSVSSKKRV